jgi:hypothetical protein
MPFVKGTSGNPYGRPKRGKSLTGILEKALSKKREDGRTNKAALADTLIEMAIKEKNVAAARYIFDRLDGKPKETVELENTAIETKLLEVFKND